jgi:nucleoid-associated protein YgaU
LAVQNAYFENLDFQPGDDPSSRSMPVQFNPAELSFTKTAQMAEIAIPGLDSPALQFVRGGNETVTVELFFDTTDSGMGDGARSVTEETDKFYRLVKQHQKTHAPPRVRFSWGDPTPALPALPEAKGQGPPGVPQKPAAPPAKPKADAAFTSADAQVSYAPFWFTGVVESVERKFLLFSPKGVPLRARLTVKMREYKTVEQMAAYLQSADHTKAHVLKRRERLDQVAAREYDAPGEWRRIAAANGLEDPRRVAPGTVLKIPPVRPEANTRRPR